MRKSRFTEEQIVGILKECKRCSAPTLRLMRLGPTLRVYETGSLHRNF